jgi:predicted acyltransferase
MEASSSSPPTVLTTTEFAAGPEAPAPPTTLAPVPPLRLTSIDAYRGLVMFLMMAEVLRVCKVSLALPASTVWKVLCFHQSHVEWTGCSLHDMIQPSFSFLVGVALPFSIASRTARGQPFGYMLAHAWWRALLLILLGVFLRSMSGPQTVWTFEDTLTQIGLGYGFLFLLGFRPARDQWIALGVILVGYWAAFALYPLPPADFNYGNAGVPAAWLEEHGLSGFAAHWQKNSNLGAAFELWFRNQLPAAKPFLFNRGGYVTLSFIPTLGTMILGLLAGNVLRGPRSPWGKIGWLVAAGALSLAAGWALWASGICPVVKRIWTPSWVLYSGGLCFFFLAAFYAVADVAKQKWLFPLVIIGMNSIAAYCIAHLFESFIMQSLKIHFSGLFKLVAPPFETFAYGAVVLLIMWLILFWMYRRKLFLRI